MKKAFLFLLFLFGLLAGLASSGPAQEAPPQSPAPATGYPLLRIDVYYEPEDKVVSMDLEDYAKYVVASEMPASFHLEALKAQAVIARTYALRKMKIFGGTPSVPGKADVTSNPAKDQAWNPEHVLKERWGLIGWWINWPKIEKAVRETQGLILTYKGLPAESVYHSTCGGQTEAAQDVWGNHVDYLQSVPCNYCASSPHYKPTQVVLSSKQVSDSVSKLGISVPASKIPQTGVIAVSSLSPTGRVKQVSVDGKTVRGLEFRSALNLKSTKFTWSVQGDNIVFQVAGYGHGVGLCQYGADGAARAGMNYLEILAYYYPGTQVAHIFEE